MKDFHAFACPVFALQNALAGGNTLPRWSPQARLGLKLGPSPSHARIINLVLSLTTGLFLPQYHCNFDDFFETTEHGMSEAPSSGIWQQLAGLTCAMQVPTVEQMTTLQTQVQPTLQPTSITTNSAPSLDDFGGPADEFVFDQTDLDGVLISDESYHEQPPPLPADTPVSGGTSSRGRQRMLSCTMK